MSHLGKKIFPGVGVKKVPCGEGLPLLRKGSDSGQVGAPQRVGGSRNHFEEQGVNFKLVHQFL